jgi:hypothetical protein
VTELPRGSKIQASGGYEGDALALHAQDRAWRRAREEEEPNKLGSLSARRHAGAGPSGPCLEARALASGDLERVARPKRRADDCRARGALEPLGRRRPDGAVERAQRREERLLTFI